MTNLNVEVTEAPGGIGIQGQCPNCSKMYPLGDDEKPQRLPENCERCGAPMDFDKAHTFANRQAADAGATPQQRMARGVRNTQVGDPPESKGDARRGSVEEAQAELAEQARANK